MAKRVLYIDNTLSYGGAMLSLKNLLRALDRSRFEPVVTSGQGRNQLRRDFPRASCYHLDIRLPWLHNPIYRRINALALMRRQPLKTLVNLGRQLYWVLCHDLPDALLYWRIGRRHEVALVHLNNILGGQLSGIIAAKLLGVPCVAHLRDFERNTFLTRLYARGIDHHVAISGAIRANLLELGIPAQRISVVHDALDLDEFSPQDADSLAGEFGLTTDTPTFGLFGRIVAWKGVLEFVEAAALVLRRHPAARAFIVGSAPPDGADYSDAVSRRIAELGLEGRVLMTGYRPDVAQLMSLMDIVVHASTRAEPFGMVVIEGMAQSRPVVATAAGGPLDIVVDGETGLLAVPGDSAALAAAITALLDDPARRAEMGRKGRERVEHHFSNVTAARRVERIYANLLTAELRAARVQKAQVTK